MKAKLLALTMLVALMGCDSPREKFPAARDFCERENRKIPSIEKKAIILTRMYFQSKRPEYIADYVDSEVNEGLQNENVRLAIKQYVRQNPLCCQMVNMDHIGNEVFNGDIYTDDAYHFDRKWGYVSDFYVFTYPESKKPFFKIHQSFRKEDLPHGTVSMVNNCADAKGHFRG